MHILYIYVQVVVGGAMQVERERARPGGSGWHYAGREREGGIWWQSVASEWMANS